MLNISILSQDGKTLISPETITVSGCQIKATTSGGQNVLLGTYGSESEANKVFQKVILSNNLLIGKYDLIIMPERKKEGV